MADLSLVFDILARDKASKELHQVGDAAETTGKRVVGGLKVIGGALAALGIGAFVTESVQSLMRIERINAQTESVIRSTGGAAGVTAQHIEDYAGALENATATEAESIQQGANLLATFTNIRNGAGANNDIFDQTVTVATDMARALNTTGDATIDMSGTAVQLGKALNDPIKGISALQKVGVSFTQTQKDQIATLVQTGDVMGAQRIILAELTKEFGGSGEAFAATAAGKYELAKHALGTFGETILTNTIPALADLAQFSADGFNAAAEGFQTGEVSAGGFEGAMQRVGIVIGDVADGVGFIVSIGKGLVDFIGGLPSPVLGAAAALGAVVLLSGPVAAGFATIAGGALATATTVVAATTSMAGFRAAGAGIVGFLGGPWGIALGVGAAALGALIPVLSGGSDETDEFRAAQTGLADAIRATSGAVDDSVRRAAAKALQDQDLIRSLGTYGIASQDLVGYVLGEADAHGRVTAALDAQRDSYNANGLVSSGLRQGIEDQRSALDALASTSSGTIADERELAEATGQASSAAGGAASATAILAAAQDQLSEDTNAAKQAVDAVRLALDQLGGQTVNTLDLESQLASAVAEATGKMEGLSGSALNSAGGLDVNSQAGRAAIDVLGGIRGAGLDLIANQSQLGESTDQLTGRATDLRAQFLAAAGQMGINEAAANALADQYGLIPDQVVTTVTANTASAVAGANDVAAAIARIPAVKTVRIITDSTGATVGRDFSNGIDARAGGGPVSANRTYLVGEEGPELVQFGASGFVTPADRTAQVLASAGRSLAPADGGISAGGGTSGVFEGNLYLDSGEFLGRVRGEAATIVAGALDLAATQMAGAA